MLHTRSRRLLVAFLLATALLLLLAALGWVQGVAAGGGLPPRPTPSPTPVIITTPVTGAAIRLHTSKPAPGAWTAVEWQNEQGTWYEVQGWRGHLDEGNADMKTWWVYPANYSEGPFRWVIYTQESGSVLATSDVFNLPTRNRQLITVEVQMP